MNITPLPRSLDPLPDESLPGYLLRLAHRLELAPSRVVLRTGLTPRREATMRASLLLSLDPDTAATFAHAVRLTVEEVNEMTMSSLATRYPPLNPQFLGRQRQIRGLFIKEHWLFSKFTRYCPDCLAGDGSLIQQRHGGAWNKHWRLPIVFACPTHRRLLRHSCPRCGGPAHARRPGRSELVPLVTHPVTHPAACRNPTNTVGPFHPCGHRLDHSDAQPRPRTTTRSGHQGLLQLQQRLINLLDAGQPTDTISVGQPTTPARYVIDLRILSCLLQASWPAGRDLISAVAPAAPVDEHVGLIRQQIAASRSSGRHVHEIQIYDKPPPDALTNATLLAAADHILSADPDTARQILRHMYYLAPFTRKWTRNFTAGAGYCSPGLREVAGVEAGAPHVVRSAGIRRQRTASAPRPVGFELRHIPQYLPITWFRDHFSAFTDVPERYLRRAVCILLARITAGGAIRAVAPRLGLPWSAGRHAVSTVSRALSSQDRRAAFHAAIDALATTLSNTATLVDYHQRRSALTTWTLTPQEWHSMTADLIGKPVNRKATLHTDWGERKRVLATVWIWTRITQGEPHFAPPLRPDPRQPKTGGDQAVYIHSRWSQIQEGLGHYAELRHRLTTYAGRLEAFIDAAGIQTLSRG